MAEPGPVNCPHPPAPLQTCSDLQLEKREAQNLYTGYRDGRGGVCVCVRAAEGGEVEGGVCICVFVCRGKRLAARETDFSSLPCLTTFGSSRPGMEPMHPVKVHETLKHSLNHWTTTKSRGTLILKVKSLDFPVLPESRQGAVGSSKEL